MEEPRSQVTLESHCGNCRSRRNSPGGQTCGLRGTSIPDEVAPHTWCADHPDHAGSANSDPAGPVLSTRQDVGTQIQEVAVDTSRQRDLLMAILADADAIRPEQLTVRQTVALWQLEHWGERRARVMSDRFDGPARLPTFGLDAPTGAPPPLPYHGGGAPGRARRRRVEPFVRASGRARAAIVLLALCALASLFELWANWLQLALLDGLERGDQYTDAELDANDMRVGVIALVGLFLTICSAVTFLRWFHRAYRNLPALGVKRTSFTTGWAIGAWFVPFLNLVRPVQIMSEIWHRSRAGRQRSGGGLIAAWWGTWVASGVVAQVSLRIVNQQTIEALHTSTQLDIASGALTIMSAACAILLIRGIDARQGDGMDTELVEQVFA